MLTSPFCLSIVLWVFYVKSSLSSRVLTLDLRQYDAPAIPSSSGASHDRSGRSPKPLLGSPFVVASPAASRTSQTPSTTYSGASPRSTNRRASEQLLADAQKDSAGGSGKKRKAVDRDRDAGSDPLPVGRRTAARGKQQLPEAIAEEGEEEDEGVNEVDEEEK